MITHSIKSNLSFPCKSRCPISIIFGYWILNRSNHLFQCPCLNEFANSFGSQNIFKMEKGPMNIRHNGHLELHENRKLVFDLKTWRILFSNNLTKHFLRSKTLTPWFYKGYTMASIILTIENLPNFLWKQKLSSYPGYCKRIRFNRKLRIKYGTSTERW